jgi:5-methylcytosine-specific restriction protein A
VLRDQPWCPRCAAEGRVEPTTSVDHIVPKAWGGTDDRANLQALCARHQQQKASREGAQGRARRAKP